MVKFSGDENQLTFSESYSTVDSTFLSENNATVNSDSVSKQEVENTKKDENSFLGTMNIPEFLDDSNTDNDVGDSSVERGLNKTLKRLKTKEGKKACSELFRKFTSFGMFLLMPLTAYIFFLMFYKGTFYIQHLVFVLHLQSLMYIVFIVFNLIELLIDNTFITMLSSSVFLFLLIIWIKKFYKVRWGRAIWKSIVFLLFYGFTFFLFLVVVVIISGWAL